MECRTRVRCIPMQIANVVTFQFGRFGSDRDLLGSVFSLLSDVVIHDMSSDAGEISSIAFVQRCGIGDEMELLRLLCHGRSFLSGSSD